MRLKQYLNEASNTNKFAADVNEIYVGFYCLDPRNGSWRGFENSEEAKKLLEKREKDLPDDVIEDQKGRAQAMAIESLKWANINGYGNTVKKVWWTAKKGTLGKAVGKPLDSRKNPTDVLLQFSNGKFLGLSAKSTKSGNIGFKNPGIGTLGKMLNVDFMSIANKLENDAAKSLELPKTKKARKKYYKDNPDIKDKIEDFGSNILLTLRDKLFSKLTSMNDDQLRKHIFDEWLNVDKNMFPYYIKVTGHGKNGTYTAKVMDPNKNTKLSAILNGTLSITPLGDYSIGISADNNKIFKIRFKYESQKLASSIKLSGDPW